MENLSTYLSGNNYPGRGVLIGRSPNGRQAVIAYFIMGRSENSRNRVFVRMDGGIRTEAFDPAKLQDPSLIIYAPVRVLDEHTVVTNGDQTDTVVDYLMADKTFEEALRSRCFEPDHPNFTPRISGIASIKDGDFSYKLSILKSDEGDDSQCLRFFYEYEKPAAGAAHLIHTYRCDGNPIPSFIGEPTRVETLDDIDEYTSLLWNNLNEDNKVSLFVRYIDLGSGIAETRIVNKHVKNGGAQK